jgi:hypothetical protein
LLLPLALAGGVAFGLLAGFVGAAICSGIWPALGETTAKPPPDLIGKFVPTDFTRDFLNKNYAAADTWLDLRKDGSFTFHQLPGPRTTDVHNVEDEAGKWTFDDQGRSLQYTIDAQGDISSYKVNGAESHVYIRIWNRAYDREMWFAKEADIAIPGRELNQLSVTDYTIQGLEFLFVILFPFSLRRGSGIRAIAYPFALALGWGGWRIFYYDNATENDVPGMAYIVSAIAAAGFSGMIYSVRQTMLSKKTLRTKTPATE